MPKIFTTLDKIKPAYDVTYKVVLFICKILLIVDILITTMSVIGRYVPFIPDPAWSEEVVLTCMSYMAVLSAALAIRRGAHIRMTAFDVYLPKTAVNYDAMFKCLAKKYNKCHKEPLPDVMTPHTMRHTFCTRMANAGMNPKALQYIMGHANIVMTLNYYAHATFHSAQEEMERLQAKAKPTAEAKPEPAAESAEETKAA